MVWGEGCMVRGAGKCHLHDHRVELQVHGRRRATARLGGGGGHQFGAARARRAAEVLGRCVCGEEGRRLQRVRKDGCACVRLGGGGGGGGGSNGDCGDCCFRLLERRLQPRRLSVVTRLGRRVHLRP